jgi:hypothetical protein
MMRLTYARQTSLTTLAVSKFLFYDVLALALLKQCQQ